MSFNIRGMEKDEAGDFSWEARKKGCLKAIKKYDPDIIFLDPPYDQGLEDRALSLLAGTPLADENTLAIVEMRRDADVSHFEELGWQVVKSKEYKTNKHIFLRRGPQ